MKRCRTCNPSTMKPLSEFSLDANRPDGHRSQCKACANKNTARYLSDHPGYAKTYHEKNKEEIARKYREQHPLKPKKTDDPNYHHNYYLANSDRIKAQSAQWQSENPDRVRELNAAREKRDRLKVKARKLVQQNIRKGKMQRLPCEVCGDPKSQAHHFDHSKPVENGLALRDVLCWNILVRKT
jgi:hypothetical protein